MANERELRSKIDILLEYILDREITFSISWKNLYRIGVFLMFVSSYKIAGLYGCLFLVGFGIARYSINGSMKYRADNLRKVYNDN